MAGQSISITRGPTTITAIGAQPAKEALDLQGLNGARFDLNLRVAYIDGTALSVTVVVETSMTNDDNPANWNVVVSFPASVSSNKNQFESATTKVLRYVRWKVSALSGTTTSVTFEVLGMAW